MRRSNLVSRPASAFFLTFLLVALAHGQYGSAIQGTIQDQSGAVVAGATVTVTNEATGAVQTTTSTDVGFYRLSALIPGKYRVSVEAPTFKEFEAAHLVVDAESVRGLNIQLQAGLAKETVVVSEQVTAVETESANISGHLTAQEIERLPQYGRRSV